MDMEAVWRDVNAILMIIAFRSNRLKYKIEDEDDGGRTGRGETKKAPLRVPL